MEKLILNSNVNFFRRNSQGQSVFEKALLNGKIHLATTIINKYFDFFKKKQIEDFKWIKILFQQTPEILERIKSGLTQDVFNSICQLNEIYHKQTGDLNSTLESTFIQDKPMTLRERLRMKQLKKKSATLPNVLINTQQSNNLKEKLKKLS